MAAIKTFREKFFRFYGLKGTNNMGLFILRLLKIERGNSSDR